MLRRLLGIKTQCESALELGKAISEGFAEGLRNGGVKMKTHVIDGVTYREVERKARVGEKVVVTNKDEGFDGYYNGCIYEVKSYAGHTAVGVTEDTLDGRSIWLMPREYAVLEPVADEAPTQSIEDILASIGVKLVALERKVAELERFTYEPAPEQTFEVGDIVRYKDDVMEIEFFEDGGYIRMRNNSAWEPTDLTLVCRANDRADLT